MIRRVCELDEVSRISDEAIELIPIGEQRYLWGPFFYEAAGETPQFVRSRYPVKLIPTMSKKDKSTRRTLIYIAWQTRSGEWHSGLVPEDTLLPVPSPYQDLQEA